MAAPVASGSTDETVRVWDIATGEELRAFQGHRRGRTPWRCQLRLPRHRLGERATPTPPYASGTPPARPASARLQSPSKLTYGGFVECLAFSPDGHRLASGHEDYAIRVWDLPADRPPRLIKTGYDLQLVASLSDAASIPKAGKSLVIVADVAGLLHFRIFDCMGAEVVNTDETKLVSQAQPLAELRKKLQPYWPPHKLNWTESDMSIRRIASILGHTLKGNTRRLRPSSSAPMAAPSPTGGNDGSVRLWDAATGEPGITFTGHTGELKSLVFTPDGQTLISAGVDRTIQAWDPATGLVRYVLEGHADTVHSLALSPDGRTLASASYDRTCHPLGSLRQEAPCHTPGTFRRGQHGRIQSRWPDRCDGV